MLNEVRGVHPRFIRKECLHLNYGLLNQTEFGFKWSQGSRWAAVNTPFVSPVNGGPKEILYQHRQTKGKSIHLLCQLASHYLIICPFIPLHHSTHSVHKTDFGARKKETERTVCLTLLPLTHLKTNPATGKQASLIRRVTQQAVFVSVWQYTWKSAFVFMWEYVNGTYSGGTRQSVGLGVLPYLVIGYFRGQSLSKHCCGQVRPTTSGVSQVITSCRDQCKEKSGDKFDAWSSLKSKVHGGLLYSN